MIANIQEEVLISLLKSKDKAAFSRLYDDYSPTLYGILLRILKSEPLAEDVLQESFLKIWMNIENFDRSKGTLFSWMLNIARNGAIDVLRSKSFKQESKNQSLDISVGMVVDRETEERAETIGVANLLETLIPEQRAVMDLLYFKGYTHVEAAKELSIPLGTLKTRARLAIQNLRRFF